MKKSHDAIMVAIIFSVNIDRKKIRGQSLRGHLARSLFELRYLEQISADAVIDSGYNQRGIAAY